MLRLGQRLPNSPMALPVKACAVVPCSPQILHDSAYARGAVDGVSARDEALRLAVAVSLCSRDAKHTKLRVSARAAPDYVRIGEVPIHLAMAFASFSSSVAPSMPSTYT